MFQTIVMKGGSGPLWPSNLLAPRSAHEDWHQNHERSYKIYTSLKTVNYVSYWLRIESNEKTSSPKNGWQSNFSIYCQIRFTLHSNVWMLWLWWHIECERGNLLMENMPSDSFVHFFLTYLFIKLITKWGSYILRYILIHYREKSKKYGCHIIKWDTILKKSLLEYLETL